MLTSLLRLLGSKQHPRGPGFRRARPHHLELSGTHIHFQTPPHSDHKAPFWPKPDKYNLFDESIYGVYPDEEDSLPTVTVFTEGWSFYGLPLFQGCIGALTLGVFIIHNPRHGNLFNPDNFIGALDDYVTSRFSPSGGSHPCVTYLNWSVAPIQGNDWVRFNTERIDDLHNDVDWVLPISESHLLFFGFSHYVHKPGTRLNQAYRELEDRIMATVGIDWSQDALRQQEAARAEAPEARLPEHREHWEWSRRVWKEEGHRVAMVNTFRRNKRIRQEEEAQARREAQKHKAG